MTQENETQTEPEIRKDPNHDLMIENLEKVSGWLQELGIGHRKELIPLQDIDLPVITTTYSVGNKDFLVLIGGDGKWIRIKTLVATPDQLPQDQLKEIYFSCLRANFALDEVTFSADDSGNLYVEADMIATTNFESFKEELMSIGNGITFFMNYMNQLGSAIDGTKNARTSDIHYL